MQRKPCGINANGCHVFHKGHTHRIGRPVLFKPFHMIDRFQTFHHGFFHNRLNIRRTKQLALYRIGLSHPEFPVYRNIVFPGQGFGFIKQFLKGYSFYLCHFQKDSLCCAQKYIGPYNGVGISPESHLSVLHLADFIAQILNFSL